MNFFQELHKDVWGLTIPLIVNEEGDKFGKSAGAPVWLDSNLTSPFNLYQFMMRLPDSQMSDMLKYFTFLIPEDIEVRDAFKKVQNLGLCPKRREGVI